MWPFYMEPRPKLKSKGVFEFYMKNGSNNWNGILSIDAAILPSAEVSGRYFARRYFYRKKKEWNFIKISEIRRFE